MNLISVQHASMFFKNKTGFRKKAEIGAVVNASFNINEGEVIAVVGESGCGKTTLGKMLVGILKPTEGRILYKGKDIRTLKKEEYKDFRLGVQMVHQDSYAALNPNRTIFQSLLAPLQRHRIVKNKNEGRDVLCELLNLVGLTPPEQFLEKYPHQLSGGQRQRILLARALSVKPKLIIADEPVSMVDVSIRISLLDLMSEMNRKFNISFIYITHDLATARYIAQNGKIMVMYLGRIIEIGQIQQSIEHPKHPYLHALVRAVPVADPSKARNIGELPLRSLEMPNPENPPSGCKFHPRCPYWTEKCQNVEPTLSEFEGVMVACHYVEEIQAKSPNPVPFI